VVIRTLTPSLILTDATKTCPQPPTKNLRSFLRPFVMDCYLFFPYYILTFHDAYDINHHLYILSHSIQFTQFNPLSLVSIYFFSCIELWFFKFLYKDLNRLFCFFVSVMVFDIPHRQGLMSLCLPF
jgi:hypothetical protein